jgi:uncharacterized lipoprotein YddW (UPF0748 family)
LFASALTAQRTEYRGFWVDTFNSTLNNHADIVTTVNNAKATKANVIFAQVRRRGDAWYLNSLEPLPDFVSIAAGFDPLADLIATAHAEGIEVHAYVIMSAVWHKPPNVARSTTGGPPFSPNHVFNQHGWNPATNSMRTGPRQLAYKITLHRFRRQSRLTGRDTDQISGWTLAIPMRRHIRSTC